MSRYSFSHEVAVPPEVAWEVVADHRGMARWTPFRRALLETEGEPAPNGVGAVRSLHLVGPPIRERVTAFEPPRRLAYEMLSGAPVRDYVGEVTLTPRDGGTLLRWSVELRPRLPGAQLAVREVIRRATRSLAEECARRPSAAGPARAGPGG